MKPEYDFSQGQRGAPIEAPRGKARITIRIDDDVLAWFRGTAHDRDGASCQALINAALREHFAADEGHLERAAGDPRGAAGRTLGESRGIGTP